MQSNKSKGKEDTGARPKLRPESIEQLAAFHELGKTIISSLDLKEILSVVMEKISELLKPRNWSLMLVDEDTNELYFEIAVGEGSDRIKELRLKMGEGIAGWVAKEKKPLLVPDVTKDPRFSRKVDLISRFTTKSIICVPLVVRNKCLGVIELINRVEEGNFEEQDLQLLTTLADYAAIAIQNAVLFKKIEEITITDDLTKLYNSRFLHNRLDHEVERARRFKQSISMIFMDLDYFKDVNDRYGHLCGSKLLLEVARLIKSTIRSVDYACRYGGDEFVILMPQTTKDNAIVVANKIRTALNEHLFLQDEGINHRLTASFGVASYPEDAKNKLDLLHMADDAMYRVKSRSRDGVAGA